MKTKHTPLPWSFESGVGDYYILFDEEENTTIGLIGKIDQSNNSHVSSEERCANINFINKACNSHYELLAACEGAIKALRKALPFLPADDESLFCGEWLDKIKEVVTKAKGESC